MDIQRESISFLFKINSNDASNRQPNRAPTPGAAHAKASDPACKQSLDKSDVTLECDIISKNLGWTRQALVFRF